MNVWANRYLRALEVKAYSPLTIEQRRGRIGSFIEWCAVRSVTRPAEVTKPIVEAYQRFLYHRRLPNGKPLSWGTQTEKLVAVKMLFKWLAKTNAILWNPASEIELPRLGRRLPRQVLTASEVETILGVPDVADPVGLRDRAILEVLYSTGMRRSEVIKLSIFDIDAERGSVHIREGKGMKDRVIPIGERATLWTEKYVRDVRADFLTDPNSTVLFVSRFGDTMLPNNLTLTARKYIKAANVGKTGSCHMFRHAMAVAMLEGGADIRFIQAILGHVRLDTTSIYTQVGIGQLKLVHERTHPGAMLHKPKTKTSKTSEITPEAEEVLSKLAEEAGEEQEP